MSVTPYQLYIGDDWEFLISAQNPDGTALNLTAQNLTPGALYWTDNMSASQGMPLTVVSGITLVNASLGQFLITIIDSITISAIPKTPAATTFPTRIQVFVTSQSGIRTTLGILYVIPLDPHSA